MIDPLLASQAERLAALRSPAQTKRQKPAHSAKIFTAGLSTTAMFGLVAAMGWPSGTGVAQGAALVEPAVTPVALTIPALTMSAPVVAAQTAPVVVPAPAVVAAPATTQPAPVPTVAAPIVIPVAVPVAQPPAARAASNTTTKSSG